MRLYQSFLSPFPARVRLAVYAKALDADLVLPPGFGAAAKEPKGAYLALNPMGRVPTLALDDGRALPESEVICEYLEERFPEPPLLPRDPWARAQVRLVNRICDLYVVLAMLPLFDALELPRAAWDRAKLDAALAEIARSFGFVERYLEGGRYAIGASLTYADAVVPTMLVLACEWARAVFGGGDPLEGLPKLQRYRAEVERDPLVARVVGELRAAIRERVAARTGRAS